MLPRAAHAPCGGVTSEGCSACSNRRPGLLTLPGKPSAVESAASFFQNVFVLATFNVAAHPVSPHFRPASAFCGVQVFQVARRAGFAPKGVQLQHVPFGLVQGEFAVRECAGECHFRCRFRSTPDYTSRDSPAFQVGLWGQPNVPRQPD